ncbi:MAG TPA: hypothetical protein VMZ49_02300 [Patescibacteria group bacterium]|nr:hypothetical protein [Patescibacteria group bacterium]
MILILYGKPCCQPEVKIINKKGVLYMKQQLSFCALRTLSVVILIIVVTGLVPPGIQAQNLLTSKQWLEDLEFTVAKLKSQHPHPYYKISEDEFNIIVSKSRDEIEHSRSDLKSFLAIRKVIAGIQDGHTQLGGGGIFDLTDLRFPFRLDNFTDGIFITVIDKEHEKYLGSRVVAINGKSIGKVLAVHEQVTKMDNKFGTIRPALMGFTFARLMNGLGITNDLECVELELITPENKTEKLVLGSLQDHSIIDWSNRLNSGPTENKEYVSPPTVLGDKTPLHLKKQGPNVEFYWFEHLKNDKAIYFQFNQVGNQPNGKETFVKFTARIWSYIDKHKNEINKLIIDIRYNDGGNGRILMPFLNEIIKRDNINKSNGLFVLVGKRTYSAAVIFMTELQEHTNAVFIGDPPACPFNFFSDAITVGNLPNSRFALRIASRQIDNAWSNFRIYFPPDIPAPFTSQDYFSGNDPALQLALHGETRTIAKFAEENGADAALEYYQKLKKKYADIEWWSGLHPDALEGNINQNGYRLFENQDLECAYQLFKLNTMLFPASANTWDSLAEYYYNIKEYDLSLKYYQRTVEINPDNEHGKKMIALINEKKNND